jgi:hypothetical protein
MYFCLNKINFILLMLDIRTSAVSENGHILAPHTVVRDVQDMRSAVYVTVMRKRKAVQRFIVLT